MMPEEATRSGFVAVVGRPNVGKSTLVNALVGEKVSIVTGKPQTTRHSIMGICNLEEAQIVFIDTPGIHEHRGVPIQKAMNRSALNALEDADVVLFVCEAGRWTDADGFALSRASRGRAKIVGALNKIDLVKRRDSLLPEIDMLRDRADFHAIVPISALKGLQLDALLGELVGLMPAGPRLYPGHASTDKSLSFRVSELIREQLLEHTHQEVPYGILVEVEVAETDDDRVDVLATIWVERESHKGIVIGSGGKRLKSIGSKARSGLSELVGKPVHIETHVRTKRNWSHDARVLRQFGIDASGS